MGKEAGNLKVAIVHDYLRTFGGGERVLLSLHKIWPNAKIYVASADYKRMGSFGEVFRGLNIQTSWVQKIPPFVKKPLLYRPLLPLIWPSIDVGNVDVVISSSGGNIAKGVRVTEGAIHICYCHTPPRYLYGYKTETNFSKIPVISVLADLVLHYLLKFDQKTNKGVDYFIANSQNVKSRIKKFYKRDSLVVYPPCFVPKRLAKPKEGLYYLVVSRLVRYKNVDLVIKTFNKLGLPLKIVGTGRDRERLQKIAKDNIELVGEASEEKLYNYFKYCKALIVTTEEEDFGITPVEAQGFGRPVIAYYSGGLRESVIEGETGIFFRRLSVESLLNATEKFRRMNFDFRRVRLNAKTFSEKRFKEQIKSFVKKVSKAENIKSKRIRLFDKVPFDLVNKRGLVKIVLNWAEKGKKRLVLNMNAYGVVTFLENRRYAKIISSADLIYPDGWGPVYASKLLNKETLSERVNVGDFIENLFEGMNERKLSLYLLGSEEEVVEGAVQKIKSKYPNINLKGFNNGFFTAKESKVIVKEIKRLKPSLVLVGMGLPTQEYWIKENWQLLPNAIYMGIGSAFNYIAGTKKRAPLFMRNHGLEWIYRLFQEPRRLGKRYTIVNLKFMGRTFVSYLSKYF